jgi:hypothetical protein
MSDLVQTGPDDLETGLPKYPRKQTFSVLVGMSQTCHFRTHEVQQVVSYSTTSVAVASSVCGIVSPRLSAVLGSLSGLSGQNRLIA